MVTAADHTLLELSAIVSNDLLHSFRLELCCAVESLGDYFVTAEVAHCLLKLWIFFGDIDDIVDKAGIAALDLGLDASREVFIRHVTQDKHLFCDLLLTQELIHDLG